MIRYRRKNKKVSDALLWDVEQVCQWLRDEPASGGGGMPQLCKVSPTLPCDPMPGLLDYRHPSGSRVKYDVH